ncbi:16S rRNA (uracil(1498)-N(3))-methyltransferase [Roseiarcaceae bacterium H3SJ34-1]|uniref:16S rRNA (uracil(1498)-N(3))-methyltransferase n=1 Tax=Terripilifer ovatus TaxID=3032367 RepID=UPI003AB96044|nr:16S rRNA (uracil(1498)-N(3))-methyltransferase [Roseiarcaceae bacterium H3SJ34-1]
MPRYDFAAQRLFVDAPLAAGAAIEIDREQTNYLLNVLRLAENDGILVFNGADGEWLARVAASGGRSAGRKSARLVVERNVRPQDRPGDVHYLFAPLKHARLDYMIQKAVEMGAARLRPVTTRRTQAQRVNLERMRANAVEAAEQCGIMNIPQVDDTIALDRLLRDWPANRRLVFCDEDAPVAEPFAALTQAFAEQIRAGQHQPAVAVVVGPEGGFDDSERKALAEVPGSVSISLGPRVLRADTAAVAALAIVQAAIGDWRTQ